MPLYSPPASRNSPPLFPGLSAIPRLPLPAAVSLLKVIDTAIDALKDLGASAYENTIELEKAGNQLEASLDVSGAAVERYKGVLEHFPPATPETGSGFPPQSSPMPLLQKVLLPCEILLIWT